MRKQGSNLRVTRAIATVLMVCHLTTVAHLSFAEELPQQSLTPLPSLNTIEECQRTDLGRYFGKTFRFHRGECFADVSIDENGKVTSFIPEDEKACRAALKVNCGWVD